MVGAKAGSGLTPFARTFARANPSITKLVLYKKVWRLINPTFVTTSASLRSFGPQHYLQSTAQYFDPRLRDPKDCNDHHQASIPFSFFSLPFFKLQGERFVWVWQFKVTNLPAEDGRPEPPPGYSRLGARGKLEDNGRGPGKRGGVFLIIQSVRWGFSHLHPDREGRSASSRLAVCT